MRAARAAGSAGVAPWLGGQRRDGPPPGRVTLQAIAAGGLPAPALAVPSVAGGGTLSAAGASGLWHAGLLAVALGLGVFHAPQGGVPDGPEVTLVPVAVFDAMIAPAPRAMSEPPPAPPPAPPTVTPATTDSTAAVTEASPAAPAHHAAAPAPSPDAAPRVPAAAPRPARQPDPALAPAPEALADTGPGPAPATDPDPALRPAPAPPAAQTGDAPPEAPPPPAALPAQSTAPRRVAKATEQPPAPAQPAAPDRQSGQGAAAPAPAAKGGGAGAEAQATLIADWGGRIRARIDRARRYPAAANGATGTVTLRLTVTPSGQVAGVALRQGSGSAILDQAAIDAVRRAGRLPRAPKGLGDAAYAFNLPIVFTR